MHKCANTYKCRYIFWFKMSLPFKHDVVYNLQLQCPSPTIIWSFTTCLPKKIHVSVFSPAPPNLPPPQNFSSAAPRGAARQDDAGASRRRRQPHGEICREAKDALPKRRGKVVIILDICIHLKRNASMSIYIYTYICNVHKCFLYVYILMGVYRKITCISVVYRTFGATSGGETPKKMGRSAWCQRLYQKPLSYTKTVFVELFGGGLLKKSTL